MKSAFGNIKVALDTNILSYLLDKTYPNLNKFIQYLNDCELIDLVCSQFVIYELIEIRKLEHYIRLIHEETTKGGGSMNFSSILKYRKDWSAPELDYKNIFTKVKGLVEKDIEKIWDDYGIEFSDKSIHEDLWKPHQNLVLTSKISKEDSLVLLSSVYPERGGMEDYLIFLTNDDKFFRAFAGKGKDKIEELDNIFIENITKPIVLKISNIELPRSGTALDLVKQIKGEEEIKKYVNKFIFEHFQEKSSDYFLGKIMSCKCKDKKDMFCFSLKAEQLNKDIYLSVLTKDLKIIHIPNPQSNFWAGGVIENYPYLPTEDNKTREISIKLLNKDGSSLISEDELNEIMVNGNLVYIHSDTYRI